MNGAKAPDGKRVYRLYPKAAWNATVKRFGLRALSGQPIGDQTSVPESV
jgi:hypothetical protein